jgi:hypothetical protein
MVIIFFAIHIISILHLASLKFQNVLKRVPSRREEMFQPTKGVIEIVEIEEHTIQWPIE